MQNYMGLAWTCLMSVYRRIPSGNLLVYSTKTEKKYMKVTLLNK